MKKILQSLATVALLSSPSQVLAATFQNPLGSVTDPVDIIFNIIEFLLTLAAPLALLGIVYGGVLLIVGGFDNEQQAARAKKILTWSIVGLAVVILAFLFIRILTSVILGI